MKTNLISLALSVVLHKSKYRSKFGAIRKEEKVDEILTKRTMTISEFKKNPNEVVKKADNAPFAVMTNNKATFYVLRPEYYDALLEHVWELEITPEILKRQASKEPHVRVTVDELMDM